MKHKGNNVFNGRSSNHFCLFWSCASFFLVNLPLNVYLQHPFNSRYEEEERESRRAHAGGVKRLSDPVVPSPLTTGNQEGSDR